MFLNGEELLNCDKDIDILFLDIQMKQLDGIETAKRMRKKNYNGFLIFITILKEMVFQSFEVQPFDYLLKPMEYDSFKSTMAYPKGKRKQYYFFWRNYFLRKKAIDQGTGIANIKAVTEKYQGAIDIKTDGNVFALSVLFIIPQHSDDISQQTNKEQ